MNSLFKKCFATLSPVLVAGLLLATAAAQCPGLPQAKLHRQSFKPGSAAALLQEASSSTDPIVGMWRTQLTSGSTIIDQTTQQWHSDGTEIMNSSRNPETQSFCLGVWQNQGNNVYKLNHYGISWDQSTSTTTPLGLGNIRETITLSKDGNSFNGTFIINQYDENGNLLENISGTVSGYRITVETNLKVLF